MSPYFWISLILSMFMGHAIGNSGIHPGIGIPLILLLAAAGGVVSGMCDRDRHNKL